jgi:chromosome segregation ATPase
MPEGIEKIGGSLLNLVLGGVILWVGQTTFRHSGVLASVDEKFTAQAQQFADVDRRLEGVRKWIESAVTDLKDSTRSNFTLRDGDKVVAQVRQVEMSTTELERRLAERLSGIEARIAALETKQQDTQQVAALQWQVAQLRDTLARTSAPAAVAQEATAYQQPVYQQSPEVARGTPVFLPPTGTRR